MVNVTPRPGRHIVVESSANGSRPAGAVRTSGTLAVPFALLKSLLADLPLKKPKRRRPLR